MKYHIEDNYYIVVDEYSYAVAKYRGIDNKGRERFDYISYHWSPEQALSAYCHYRKRKAASENDGNITDLLRILANETTRQTEIMEGIFERIKEQEIDGGN